MTNEQTELPEEVVQQYIDGLEYHIRQGLISRSQLEYINNTSRRRLNELLTESGDFQPKEYLSKDQGMKAYSKILDTGITAQEALEYVAEFYGKDQEWVDEVKNNNYLHAKEVFYAHREHTVQKAMAKDGTLRPKALKNSDTPNKQLRELSSQRKLHGSINSLKEDNIGLAGKVEDLEVKAIIAESNIDLVMVALELEQLPIKEKAKLLKEKGLTQKKIAEYLCISLPTVKRWFKQF